MASPAMGARLRSAITARRVITPVTRRCFGGPVIELTHDGLDNTENRTEEG